MLLHLMANFLGSFQDQHEGPGIKTEFQVKILSMGNAAKDLDLMAGECYLVNL